MTQKKYMLFRAAEGGRKEPHTEKTNTVGGRAHNIEPARPAHTVAHEMGESGVLTIET